LFLALAARFGAGEDCMSQKKEGPGPPITRRQMLAQAAKGAALASLVPVHPTQALLAETPPSQGTKPSHAAAKLIALETDNLKLSVDPANCRWSAQLKGSEMQLNDVHFLPGDDPSGWTVTSSVDRNDSSNLGSFETVTLHGTKHGHLDFEYRISASKTGNDILRLLRRAAGWHHGQMGQPGNALAQPRLLRAVAGGDPDYAQIVCGKPRGKRSNHRQHAADGPRHHPEGRFAL
jgi:hypothetical protein